MLFERKIEENETYIVFREQNETYQNQKYKKIQHDIFLGYLCV